MSEMTHNTHQANGNLPAVNEARAIGEAAQEEAGFEKLFKLDDWNDVVVVARGNKIRHYLNNRLIVDFSDNDPALALHEGILALQLHAGKPMWVEFKNIRIKDLK